MTAAAAAGDSRLPRWRSWRHAGSSSGDGDAVSVSSSVSASSSPGVAIADAALLLSASPPRLELRELLAPGDAPTAATTDGAQRPPQRSSIPMLSKQPHTRVRASLGAAPAVHSHQPQQLHSQTPESVASVSRIGRYEVRLVCGLRQCVPVANCVALMLELRAVCAGVMICTSSRRRSRHLRRSTRPGERVARLPVTGVGLPWRHLLPRIQRRRRRSRRSVRGARVRRCDECRASR